MFFLNFKFKFIDKNGINVIILLIQQFEEIYLILNANLIVLVSEINPYTEL